MQHDLDGLLISLPHLLPGRRLCHKISLLKRIVSYLLSPQEVSLGIRPLSCTPGNRRRRRREFTAHGDISLYSQREKGSL